MTNIISLPVIPGYSEIQFNIALLGLNWYRDKDPRIPLGLAMIGSYLLNKVNFVGEKKLYFLNYDVRDNLSICFHEIMVKNPKILGIGVYVWNSEEVKIILHCLRTLGYAGIIILGGPEITYGNATVILKYPEAQYFVKGDGEKAFLQIVLKESGYNVPWIEACFNSNSKSFEGISKIKASEIISPFQNNLLRNNLFGDKEFGFTRWQTQRGCVYRCTFCAFPNGYHNLLEVDLDYVKQDLEVFAQEGIKEVAVLDPIFFVHKERGKKILQLIKVICPNIKFEIQTKIEHLDNEIIELISQLNIVLECGVQTFDPIVQNEIKRYNNKTKIEGILGKLQHNQIAFEVHLIFGLPKQTHDSFLEDYFFLKQFDCEIKTFPLSRLRGTRLDLAIKTGEYDEGSFTFSPMFPHEVIETKWMNSRDVLSLKLGEELLKHQI